MRLTALLATIVAAYLLVSVGCNSSKLVVDDAGPQATDRLSQAIAGAKGQVAPDGVEPSLWEQLIAEFVRVLELRRDGQQRVPSMLLPPLDLTANNGVISWTEHLSGDYDNNGEVNLADITAIALHFGQTVDSEARPEEYMVRIDGDGNKEINLGDITPIAMHFGEVLSGYSVLFSETLGGTSYSVSQVPRAGYWHGIESQSNRYAHRVGQSGYFCVSPSGVGQTAASRSYKVYCDYVYVEGIGNNTDPNPGESEEPLPDDADPGLDIESLQDQLDDLQLEALDGNGFLTGRVVDPTGVGVESATIVVPGIGPVVSNEEGYFAIPDVGSTARMPVDVICPGYTLGTELVRVDGMRERFFTITLLPLKSTKLIDFDEGGQMVEYQTGAMVVFEPGDIVDGADEVITGVHEVSISPVDVTDQAELDSVPGRLEAGQMDGSLAFLQTFGMMEIFVDDGLGNKCNIAPGRSIRVTIPIPVNARPIAPDRVGMYSFDAVSAIWIEEGEMVKSADGKKYIARIPHLSWWNPDKPAEVATMKLKVMGEDDVPIPNLRVDYFGVDYQGSWSSSTNQDGIARLMVKVDSQIIVKVSLLDQEVIYEEFLNTPVSSDNGGVEDSVDQIEIYVPMTQFDCTGTLLWGRYPEDLDIIIGPSTGKGSVSLDRELGYYFNTRDSHSFGPEKVTFWFAKPDTYRISVVNKSGQESFPLEQSGAFFVLALPGQDYIRVQMPVENPENLNTWVVMDVIVQPDGETILVEVINLFAGTSNT